MEKYIFIAMVLAIVIILIKSKKSPVQLLNIEKVLAQADVYIAYSQYEQAKEHLEKALIIHPNNIELKNKLESIIT